MPPLAVKACVAVPVGVLKPLAFTFPFTSSFSVADTSVFPTPVFPLTDSSLFCLEFSKTWSALYLAEIQV